MNLIRKIYYVFSLTKPFGNFKIIVPFVFTRRSFFTLISLIMVKNWSPMQKMVLGWALPSAQRLRRMWLRPFLPFNETRDVLGYSHFHRFQKCLRISWAIIPRPFFKPRGWESKSKWSWGLRWPCRKWLGVKASTSVKSTLNGRAFNKASTLIKNFGRRRLD